MGRLRKYSSAAEKMQAYRQRKAHELAELRMKADNSVRSREIVEVAVEKLLTPQTTAITRVGKFQDRLVFSDDRQRVMTEKLVGRTSGIKESKRLQVNAKKAASCAEEMANILKALPIEQRELMAADVDLLEKAEAVFNSYSQVLTVVAQEAELAEELRLAKLSREHEGRIAATKHKLFGESLVSEVVNSLASDLLRFASEIEPWVKQRYDVDKGFLDVNKYELRQTLLNGNVTKTALFVSEACLQLPQQGNVHQSNDVRCWFGGWEDFIKWRATI